MSPPNALYVFFLAAASLLAAAPCNAQTEDPMTLPAKTESAVFAGGCFWCLEAAMENTPGVLEAISGYTGGHDPDPTYASVSTGRTGHVEAVRVIYDSTTLSYEDLVRVFFRNINPSDPDGQFADRGSQYQTAIFYATEAQKQTAEAVMAEIAASGRFKTPLAVPLRPVARFYPAEEQHQNYYAKNAVGYDAYHRASGRGPYLETVWGQAGAPRPDGGQPGPAAGYVRPDDQELRARLSPLAFAVTRKNATEPPFDNAHWNEKRPGIYVDAVSGEPLFSSRDKFDSGTGWPSFTRTVVPGAVAEREDTGLFTVRTEVRSALADSHLGHVFDDGPPPTGKRYCVNSAALRFIPVEDMEKEGYGGLVGLVRPE